MKTHKAQSLVYHPFCPSCSPFWNVRGAAVCVVYAILVVAPVIAMKKSEFYLQKDLLNASFVGVARLCYTRAKKSC